MENFGKALKTGEFWIREYDIKEKGIKILKIGVYWEIRKEAFGDERDLVLVITRGEGKIILPGKVVKAREGDIVLIKKDEEYKIAGNFDAIGIMV